jgi:hypothetical protein
MRPGRSGKGSNTAYERFKNLTLGGNKGAEMG